MRIKKGAEAQNQGIRPILRELLESAIIFLIELVVRSFYQLHLIDI